MVHLVASGQERICPKNLLIVYNNSYNHVCTHKIKSLKTHTYTHTVSIINEQLVLSYNLIIGDNILYAVSCI